MRCGCSVSERKTGSSEAPRPSTPRPGNVILLNGASSSGKSTLAQDLQARLDEPFWHFSIDHLIAPI
ncbi:MAG: phosphotransferase-like protein [bacterium]